MALQDPYAPQNIVEWEGRTEREPTEEMDAIALEARLRRDEAFNAEKKFRDQLTRDREFYERQYRPQDLYVTRGGSPKPAMEYHLCRNQAEMVMSDYRESGLGFEIGSATSESGTKAVKFFSGLARRDQHRGGAAKVMERIVRDAVLYGEGWGYWQISDRSKFPVGRPNLYVDGKFNNRLPRSATYRDLILRHCEVDHVYADPFDRTDDKSEMRWLLHIEEMPLEERNRRWPDAKRLPANIFEPEISASTRWWFPMGPYDESGPPRDKRCMIAHYYRRITKQATYVWAPGLGNDLVLEDMLTPEQKAIADASPDAVRTREQADVVELHVTDGYFSLQPKYICNWGLIPYFRCLGERQTTTGGQELKRGTVFYFKDLSKLMSVTISDATHRQSVAAQDGFIAQAEAIEEHKKDWADVTVFKGVRRYNAYSSQPGPNGVPLKLDAPVYQTPQPAVDSALKMVQAGAELAARQAGAADPQQRDTTNQYRSADSLSKIEELARAQRSLYGSNAREFIRRGGEVWLSMSREVYAEPGRLIQIAAEADDKPDEGVIIGVPFVRDPKGKPVPLPQLEATPEVEEIPLDPRNPELGTMKVYRFNPRTDAVKVTTFASSTQDASKDKTFHILRELLTSAPQMAPAIAPAMLRKLSDRFPVEDVAKAIELAFPQPADPTDTDIATLSKRHLALMNEVEVMKQQMAELQKAADTNQTAERIEANKAAARMEETELKERYGYDKAKMADDTKRDVAVLQAATKADGEDKALEAEERMVGFTAAMDAAKETNDGGATRQGGAGGTGGGGGGSA